MTRNDKARMTHDLQALHDLRGDRRAWLTRGEARAHLEALKNRGLAVSTGRGPAARWRRVSESAEDE